MVQTVLDDMVEAIEAQGDGDVFSPAELAAALDQVNTSAPVINWDRWEAMLARAEVPALPEPSMTRAQAWDGLKAELRQMPRTTWTAVRSIPKVIVVFTLLFALVGSGIYTALSEEFSDRGGARDTIEVVSPDGTVFNVPNSTRFTNFTADHPETEPITVVTGDGVQAELDVQVLFKVCEGDATGTCLESIGQRYSYESGFEDFVREVIHPATVVAVHEAASRFTFEELYIGGQQGDLELVAHDELSAGLDGLVEVSRVSVRQIAPVDASLVEAYEQLLLQQLEAQKADILEAHEWSVVEAVELQTDVD